MLCMLLILLASRVFPWSFFDKHFPSLQNSFQAPTRLVILIYPLFLSVISLSLSLLSSKSKDRKWRKTNNSISPLFIYLDAI